MFVLEAPCIYEHGSLAILIEPALVLSLPSNFTPPPASWDTLQLIVPVGSSYKGGHYIVTYTSTYDCGQDLDPSNFRPWLLDHTKNLALTLDYPALTTPIDHLESFWPFLSCPQFHLTSSKFRLDCLTSLWPRSWVGVQLPMQCLPLKYSRKYGIWISLFSFNSSSCPRAVWLKIIVTCFIQWRSISS